MKNQDIGRNWNLAFSASKPMWHGLSLRTAYSYGEAKNTIDPGSTAIASWNSNPTPGDPNNPGLGFSTASPGHRFFLSASLHEAVLRLRRDVDLGVLGDAHARQHQLHLRRGRQRRRRPIERPDLHPARHQSEMNFTDIHRPAAARSRPTSRPTAFEAYIAQDKYLSAHRGEYAQRGAVFLPLLHKLDLSITQDVFKNIKGKRNAGQFRIDIQNFGNLLNSNWGVGQRVIRNNILTHAGWRTRSGAPELPHAGRQQPVGEQDVRIDQRHPGRLPVHAQLPVFVQLSPGLAGLAGLRAYDGKGRVVSDPPVFFLRR